MASRIPRQTRRADGNIHITDLGEKIRLLLESESSPVSSQQQLIKVLGIGKDLFSRIMSGTRVLTEERFIKLSEAFNVKRNDWHVPLHVFGENLGFSRQQIAIITGTPFPGIDFASRIKDRDQLRATFQLIAGYWESYYFSVSKINEVVVSRDLLIVKELNDDSFIECEVDDSVFNYRGWCFPTGRHLYFILEKSALFDEIIVYATNRPDRTPPRLYGVILCLSGGIDEIAAHPCAAKVAFRYLGNSSAAAIAYGVSENDDIDLELRRRVPTYISPTDAELDVEVQGIFRDISNVIKPDDIPSALRMTK